MSFPTQAEALSLHERALQRDPVVSVDVFQAFMGPLQGILNRKRGCTREDARDSAIDAVISYLDHPERYDPQRAPLSTYLTQAAKNQLMDRQRSAGARTRREQEFATDFELQARSPKEAMEISMEARHALEQLEQLHFSEEERVFLGLILQGERSTRRLAEALGLGSLSELDLRREVKRRRDRLMKRLERLGKEDSDVES